MFGRWFDDRFDFGVGLQLEDLLESVYGVCSGHAVEERCVHDPSICKLTRSEY